MTGKPPVLSGEPLLVPYLSRLAKLIHSDDPAVEGLDLLTLQNILQDANAKPALIRLLLPELQRPDANTTPPVPDPQTLGYPPATHMKSLTVPGPVVVGILLSAAATYVRDPKTDIIEAEEDPEVVAAVVRYLHRADQTPATLAETIRSIALTGGGSDPALSNELVPLLDSASPLVRSALLQWLPSIQLSPAAYAVARGKLEAMALDGSTPAGLRAMTRELLGCWSNNRHVMCVVQPL